jgi:hypothetical protein
LVQESAERVVIIVYDGDGNRVNATAKQLPGTQKKWWVKPIEFRPQ